MKNENVCTREALAEAMDRLRKTLTELEVIAAQMDASNISQVETTNWQTVSRSVLLISRGPKALNHAIFEESAKQLMIKAMQEKIAKEKAQRATKRKAKE